MKYIQKQISDAQDIANELKKNISSESDANKKRILERELDRQEQTISNLKKGY